MLLTVTTLAFFVGAGINFHLIAYLDDQGVDASVATYVLTAWAACALVGGVGMGFIGDRIAVKLLMAGAFAGLSASMLLLLQVTSVQTAFLWAAAYGITFGATTTLYQLVWPVYFGREALGAIRGVVTAFNMTSNALGPLAAGLVFDATDSYALIWWVDLIMLAAVAAADAHRTELAQSPAGGVSRRCRGGRTPFGRRRARSARPLSVSSRGGKGAKTAFPRMGE